MTITTEQAVALAAQYGVNWTEKTEWTFKLEQLTAMLNANEQKVIDRLAQQSGVMPVVMCVAGDLQDDVPVITEGRVREAIAAMQARVEQLENALQIAMRYAQPAINNEKESPANAQWMVEKTMQEENFIHAAMNKKSGKLA